MANLPTPLGSLERQLLEWLFERAWVEVRAAHAALPAPSRRSPNTVHSALERLIRKGLVERRRSGRAFEYRAAVSRARFLEAALADTFESLPGSDPQTLLAAFVDVADRLDATALEELERLVAERRRRAVERGHARAAEPERQRPRATRNDRRRGAAEDSR